MWIVPGPFAAMLDINDVRYIPGGGISEADIMNKSKKLHAVFAIYVMFIALEACYFKKC